MPEQNAIFKDPEFNKHTPEEKASILQELGISPLPDTSVMNMFKNRRRSAVIDTGIEFIRPIAAGAAGVLGAGAGLVASPVGSAALGAAAYTGVDAALQHLESKPPESIIGNAIGEPGSFTSTIGNTAQNALMNKAAGAVIGAAGTGVKHLMGKLPKPVAGSLDELEPTFAQSLKPGMFKDFTSWISSFSQKSVEKAASGSGKKSDKALRTLAFKTSRNFQLGKNVTADLADSIVDKVPNALAALDSSADDAATGFLNIASKNIGGPRALHGMMGLTLPTPIGQTVEGPVKLIAAAQKVQNYLLSKQKDTLGPAGVPETIKGTINEATDFLKNIGAKINPLNGQVESVNEISARQAWDLQKRIGNFSYSRGGTKDLMGAYGAIGDDMEQSIAKWQYDPGKTALNGYKNAKAITAMKYNLFKNADEAPTVSKLLDGWDKKSNIPFLDTIMGEEKQLAEVLRTGKLPIPQVNGTTKILDTKLKEDLGGYYIDKMRLDHYIPSSGTFNTQAMLAELGNPRTQKIRDLLYTSKEQSNLFQLTKNMDEVSKKGPTMAGRGLLYAGRAGYVLSAGLMSGQLGPYQLAGVGLTGALLTGKAIARVMNNKTAARYLLAAANGAPLGASQTLVAKTIREALKGVPVGMINANGVEVEGMVDSEGNWKPKD